MSVTGGAIADLGAASMPVLFHCVVPGKPIPQGRARTTRFGTYYPKTSKAWRAVLHEHFRLAYQLPKPTLQCGVWVVVEVAGARANSDLDNHAKMVLDALQTSGVIVGDDVRVVRELIVRVIDGEPRTVVTIRKALEGTCAKR